MREYRMRCVPIGLIIVGCLFPQSFLVAQESEAAPPVPRFVLGLPGLENGRAIRELAAQPEAWAECRKQCDLLLYADHVLNRQFPDDAELVALLGRFREMKLPLQLEVGAVKPWGPTGEKTFQVQKPLWDRFLRCGAMIHGIAMDEPLNCCRNHLKKDAEYAAGQTADFIARVRRDFPEWSVGDIEGFPSLQADEVIAWIDLLEAKLRARNVRGLDFFRLDCDWMHFVRNTGRGSWQDFLRIERHCRQRKIAFSVVYWPANYPALGRQGLADDRAWFVGTVGMVHDHLLSGGRPDQVVVQSWVDGPKTFLPETEPFSMTATARTVQDIINNNSLQQ